MDSKSRSRIPRQSWHGDGDGDGDGGDGDGNGGVDVDAVLVSGVLHKLA